MKNDLDWNVLATAHEGKTREVRGELAALVSLRRTPFRNVLVGRVDDFQTLAVTIEAQRERKPFLERWLARIVPIERTFRVEPKGVAAALAEAAAPLVERLVGRSFHVRVERRGHKGEIDSHLVEQELGNHLHRLLEERSAMPLVAFEDPDVVVAVELLGDVGGVGLVTRELRARCTFVRID